MRPYQTKPENTIRSLALFLDSNSKLFRQTKMLLEVIQRVRLPGGIGSWQQFILRLFEHLSGLRRHAAADDGGHIVGVGAQVNDRAQRHWAIGEHASHDYAW